MEGLPEPNVQRETRARFSLIVPCFNEEAALPDTILKLKTEIGHSEFELILVNDGSTDGTGEALSRIQEEHGDVIVLSHEQNRGYGAALKTGIRSATSDLIVITDADGTYPNERIPELVGLAERFDMVVGSRTGEDVQYSRIRKIPKFFLKAYASWIAARHIPDLNSGLRVFRKKVAEQYLHMFSDGFSFTTTSTLAFMTNGYTVHYEPISFSARIGRSKIKPIRDTLQFAQLIARMGMYFAPLRVFSPFILISGVMFFASLTYDLFVIHDLTDKTVILLMIVMNTTFFALIADMIDKRGR